jgi:hypothetical protein
MNLTYLTDRRAGVWLEFFARAAAILIALTYAEGYWVGQQVHELNDALAQRRVPRPPRVGPLWSTLKRHYQLLWLGAPQALVNYLHRDA